MQGIPQSFEQRSLLYLKPIAVITQLLCVFACLGGLVLVNFSVSFSPMLYGWIVLAAVGVVTAQLSRHLLVLWLAGSLVLFACAVCVGLLATLWGDATFWFLPIGLTMSLPVAAVYHRPYQFVLTCALIWVTLTVVMQPQFGYSVDLLLILVIILAGVTAGMVVCTAFFRIRRAVFNLHIRLHTLAYIDALTGLPNRRAFMEKLSLDVDRRVADAELYFFMLDIDDFKKVNDGHGHEAGDAVLIEVGHLLNEQALGHNRARLGGEEFAVAAFLPSPEVAQHMAQQLVDAMRARDVRGLHVSLSVGLAQFQPGESMADLMRRADGALYQAKQAGKGRFVVASTQSAE